MNKLSPDHKTIAEFRRKNARVLKEVFKDFVKLCIEFNLYGKELVAIDGSKFKAWNSKDKNFTLKKNYKKVIKWRPCHFITCSCLSNCDSCHPWHVANAKFL